MAKALHAELEGQDAFKSVLKRMEDAVQQKVIRIINVGALKVQSTAAKSIQTSSGNFKEDADGHFSSPPGTPPNADTGNLASRIRVSKKATVSDPSAAVSSFAAYSSDQEFGTRNMEPRPFMGPALKEHTDDIQRQIAQAIRDGLQEGDS